MREEEQREEHEVFTPMPEMYVKTSLALGYLKESNLRQIGLGCQNTERRGSEKRGAIIE